MFGTNHVAAQDKGVSFSGGSDLVSSYYWRGVKESGPAPFWYGFRGWCCVPSTN